jgi:hypothetical protein
MPPGPLVARSRSTCSSKSSGPRYFTQIPGSWLTPPVIFFSHPFDSRQLRQIALNSLEDSMNLAHESNLRTISNRTRSVRSAWPPLAEFARPILLSICVTLLFAVNFDLLTAQQLPVDQILERVGETYRDLQSYQLEGNLSTQIAAVGEIQSPDGGRMISNTNQSKSYEFSLTATNPDKVRLVLKNEWHDILLISNSSTTWIYLRDKKQYTDAPTTDWKAHHLPESRANAQLAFVDQYQDILVKRYQGSTSGASKFVAVKDRQLKIGKVKVECYVLKLTTDNGTHELWVDKTHFIVWRSRDTSPVPQEGIVMNPSEIGHLRRVG